MSDIVKRLRSKRTLYTNTLTTVMDVPMQTELEAADLIERQEWKIAEDEKIKQKYFEDLTKAERRITDLELSLDAADERIVELEADLALLQGTALEEAAQVAEGYGEITVACAIRALKGEPTA